MPLRLQSLVAWLALSHGESVWVASCKLKQGGQARFGPACAKGQSAAACWLAKALVPKETAETCQEHAGISLTSRLDAKKRGSEGARETEHGGLM